MVRFRKAIWQSVSRNFDPEISLLEEQNPKEKKKMFDKALTPKRSSLFVETRNNLNAQRQRKLTKLRHNRATSSKYPPKTVK